MLVGRAMAVAVGRAAGRTAGRRTGIARPLSQHRPCRAEGEGEGEGGEGPARPGRPKAMKRFYKTVDVAAVEGGAGYTVLLDGRQMKTPARAGFAVRSQELAALVAAEWDTQDEEIETSLLYLTGLCNSAIDAPMGLGREARVANLLPFLETDTVLLHAESPDAFVDMQKEHWGPVVEAFAARLGSPVHSTYLLSPPDQPAATLEAVQAILHAYTEWQLTGVELAVESARSLILGLDVVQGHRSAHDGMELALLEQRFQTERFGYIEWSHGFSESETALRLSAAALFTQLSQAAGQ